MENDKLDAERIQRLMEDMSLIKKTIQKNTSIIQYVSFPRSMRLTALLSVFIIVIFSLGGRYISEHFGGFANAPTNIKLIFFSSLAGCIIAAGIVKTTSFLRSAREIKPNISFLEITKSFYTFPTAHVHFTLAVVTIFSVLFTILNGYINYLIPVLSITTGLYMVAMGAVWRILAFLVPGYWLVIIGIILFLLKDVAPSYELIFSYGIAMAAMAGFGYLGGKNKVEG